MDEVDELIGLARDIAEEIVGVASELLSAGIDIDRVQSRYVVAAVELLADAEAQGLLAADGDHDALAVLASIAEALVDLRARAESDLSGGR